MRLVDKQRQQIEKFDGRKYLDYIAEQVEDWTYLKFPYYKKLGWPEGVYRVGPLGRLNAAQKIATPLAQAEYQVFQQLRGGQVVEGTLYYHYARLIEDLYAVEHVRELLEDPDILGTDIQNNRPVTNGEGVGVIEAPRGTLWHHYWMDENGQAEQGQPDRGHRQQQLGHEPRAVDSVAKTMWTARTSPKGCSTASRRPSAATIPASPARPTPSARCRWSWCSWTRMMTEIRRYTRD